MGIDGGGGGGGLGGGSGSSKACKTLTIVVQDHGIGISAEDQAKLWVPFALIRPGDAQEGRGSGLGLPLAKEIITLHGECAWVWRRGAPPPHAG
jgi:hypothetical protein